MFAGCGLVGTIGEGGEEGKGDNKAILIFFLKEVLKEDWQNSACISI